MSFINGSIKSIDNLEAHVTGETLKHARALVRSGSDPFDEEQTLLARTALVNNHRLWYNRRVANFIATLQAVNVLCHFAILYLLKDNFRLGPWALQISLGFLHIPWAIKPVWGLLADSCPIFKSGRRAYACLGSLLSFFSMLFVGTIGYRNMYYTILGLFYYHVGTAICNVVGEALLVEAGRTEASSDGQVDRISCFFLIRESSFAITSYFSGSALNFITKEALLTASAVIPLAVFFASCFIVEAEKTPQPLLGQITKIIKVISEPEIRNAIIFIFAMMATPSAGTALFYFMANELHFPAEMFGLMAFVQSLASLIGIYTYMRFAYRLSLRSLLVKSTLAIAPLGLIPIIVVNRWNVPLHIPDRAFLITDTAFLEFLGQIQTMPLLVLAAKLCPLGLESTIYATIISVYNIGSLLGNFISAFLVKSFGITDHNFDLLPHLIVICVLTNGLPLVLLKLVPDTKPLLNENSSDPKDEYNL